MRVCVVVVVVVVVEVGGCVGVWEEGGEEEGREIALAPLAVGCFSFGAGGGWCPC